MFVIMEHFFFTDSELNCEDSIDFDSEKDPLIGYSSLSFLIKEGYSCDGNNSLETFEY